MRDLFVLLQQIVNLLEQIFALIYVWSVGLIMEALRLDPGAMPAWQQVLYIILAVLAIVLIIRLVFLMVFVAWDMLGGLLIAIVIAIILLDLPGRAIAP